MGIVKLLMNPNEFFINFNQQNKNLLVLLTSFLLFATGNILSIFVTEKTDWSLLKFEDIISIGLLIILEFLLNFIIINGLWILFIRIFKGKAKLKDIIFGVGYALLWPSILNLLVAICQIPLFQSYGEDLFDTGIYRLMFMSLMAIRIWALINSAIAVNYLNQFGKDKTFLAAFGVGLVLILKVAYLI